MLGYGYLLVYYQPALPADQLSQLREFVSNPDGGHLVGGTRPEQAERLKAINAFKTMTCDEFDFPALKTFARTWFADPRSRPPA